MSRDSAQGPALNSPKVRWFSVFVTANDHEDQNSNNYGYNAAKQNQVSWHEFSSRLY